MNDTDQKIKILDEIWAKYVEIRPILVLAGIQENRLPEDTTKYLLNIEDVNINKLRHGKNWIHNFAFKEIAAWQKIRKENSEQYWETAKLMKWGNDFLEVKALNEASKMIRIGWFTNHNALIIPKKPKVEKTNE